MHKRDGGRGFTRAAGIQIADANYRRAAFFYLSERLARLVSREINAGKRIENFIAERFRPGVFIIPERGRFDVHENVFSNNGFKIFMRRSMTFSLALAKTYADSCNDFT